MKKHLIFMVSVCLVLNIFVNLTNEANALFPVTEIFSDINVSTSLNIARSDGDIAGRKHYGFNSFMEDESGKLHFVYMNEKSLKYLTLGTGQENWTTVDIEVLAKTNYFTMMSVLSPNEVYLVAQGVNRTAEYDQYCDAKIYHLSNGTVQNQLTLFNNIGWESEGSRDTGENAVGMLRNADNNISLFLQEEGWWSYGCQLYGRILDTTNFLLGSQYGVSTQSSGNPDHGRNSFRAALLKNNGDIQVYTNDNEGTSYTRFSTATQTDYTDWTLSGVVSVLTGKCIYNAVGDDTGNTHSVLRLQTSPHNVLYYSLNLDTLEEIVTLGTNEQISEMDIFYKSNGELLVVYCSYNTTTKVYSELFLVKKPAGGSWETPVQISSGTTTNVDDRNWTVRNPRFVRSSVPNGVPSAVCLAYTRISGARSGNQWTGKEIKIVKFVDSSVDYDLITVSIPGGSVTAPGEGTNTYNSGTVVSLVATPEADYKFVNWTGDVGTIADVNSAETTMTMDGDYSVTANFISRIINWNSNQVLGQNGSYDFAGIYEFDELIIGDNIEITSSGISQTVIKVNGTLTFGQNVVIRVRNGFYAEAPVNTISNLTEGNLNTMGTDAGGFRVYPDMFGQGGDGGNGGSYAGSGGGGGYGGGKGGSSGYFGGSGYDNGGNGNHSSYYTFINYGIGGVCCDLGGHGGDGGYPEGYAGGSGGGNGGNGGNGSSYSGGSGCGGGGGYGGGILTIIASKIILDEAKPPRLLVSGQRGGLGAPSNGTDGGNGEGGLIIIESPDFSYTPTYTNLNSDEYGAHVIPATNGGHGIVTDNPQRVFVNGVLNIVYDLTAASTEGGLVTDPGEGAYIYNIGTVVNLVATPEAGYHFVDWTGAVADPDSASTTVTMDGDKSVTANFAINTYEVDVTSTEGGSTDKDGANSVTHGNSLTITATPETGYQFTGWSGDATGTDNPLTITNITAEKGVTANFELITYGLMTSSTTGGSVTDPGEGTNTYNTGTVVNLIAAPETGYRFVNWTGDVGTVANINAAATTITLDGDYSIRATFEPDIGDLTVTIEPTDAITDGGQWSIDSGENWHNSGTTLPLTVGDYTITYQEIAEWEKPEDDPVTITTNGAVDHTGTYTRPVPTATIDSILPNPANVGEVVEFSGTGGLPEQQIIAYEWYLVRLVGGEEWGDPQILGTNQHMFDNSLSAGDYRIYFRVQNSYNEWSEALSRDISITDEVFSDLVIHNEDIIFQDEYGVIVHNPQPEDTVRVTVTIHNIGPIDTPDEVTLSLYEDEVIEGNLLGQSTVGFIAFNDSETLQVPWLIDEEGCKVITAVAEYTVNLGLSDSEKSISEAAYQNNRATSVLPVGDADACDGGITVTADLSTSPLYTRYSVSIFGEAHYDWGTQMPVMGAEVTIYLSNGATYQTRTIAPTGHYSKQITLPSVMGSYTATVMVFDGHRTGRIEIPLEVVEPLVSHPDLSGSVSFSGDGIYQVGSTIYSVVNTEVQIQATVRNSGGQIASGGFDILFYNGLPATGILLGTSTLSGDLGAGESIVVQCLTTWLPDTLGNYTIYVQIDPQNIISESNEYNNECGRTIGIREEMPDLRPFSTTPYTQSGLSFSKTPVTGETITIFIDIYNAGPGDFGDQSFEVAYYLDSLNSPQLETQIVSGPIPVGGKVISSIEWDTNDVSPGYHQIYVLVDTEGEIIEDFENNNQSSKTIDVYSVEADLCPTAMGFSNYCPAPSTEISIQTTLKNRGGEESLDAVVEFYQGNPDAGSVLIGTAQSGVMAGGSSHSVSCQWTTPDIDGWVQIYVRVNGHTYSRSLRIYQSVPPPADLRIYSTNIGFSPAAPCAGDDVSVWADISNISSTTATDFSVNFYADSSGGTTLLGSTVAVATLSSQTTVRVNATETFLVEQLHYTTRVEIIPGPEGEANPADNQATTSFTDAGSLHAEAGPAQTVYVGETVQLNGNGSTGPVTGYEWQIKSKPSGSTALLMNPDTADPTLVPDVSGQCMMELRITDGSSFDWDEVKIIVNELITYGLTAGSTTGGSVTDPGEGTNTYNTGTVVNLIATPEAGYHFVDWTGAVADQDSASTTVTMDGDKSVTANFAINTYEVDVSSTTGGSTDKDDANSVTHGNSLSIKATPEIGYQWLVR